MADNRYAPSRRYFLCIIKTVKFETGYRSDYGTQVAYQSLIRQRQEHTRFSEDVDDNIDTLPWDSAVYDSIYGFVMRSVVGPSGSGKQKSRLSSFCLPNPGDISEMEGNV